MNWLKKALSITQDVNEETRLETARDIAAQELRCTRAQLEAVSNELQLAMCKERDYLKEKRQLIVKAEHLEDSQKLIEARHQAQIQKYELDLQLQEDRNAALQSRCEQRLQNMKEDFDLRLEEEARIKAEPLVKEAKKAKKEAEARAQELAIENAALKAKNEMLEQMIDVGADVEDMKAIMDKLFAKLPNVDLSNVTLNTTVETVQKACKAKETTKD